MSVNELSEPWNPWSVLTEHQQQLNNSKEKCEKKGYKFSICNNHWDYGECFTAVQSTYAKHVEFIDIHQHQCIVEDLIDFHNDGLPEKGFYTNGTDCLSENLY